MGELEHNPQEKTGASIKAEIIQALADYLQPLGFSANRSRGRFTRKDAEKNRQEIKLNFTFYGYMLELECELGVTIAKIDQFCYERIYGWNRELNTLKPTLEDAKWWVETGSSKPQKGRNGSISIAYGEDTAHVCEEICRELGQYAIPYFEANTSMERVNILLNSEIGISSLHQILTPMRGTFGITAAYFLKDPALESYIEQHEAASKDANTFFEKSLDMIVDIIRQGERAEGYDTQKRLKIRDKRERDKSEEKIYRNLRVEMRMNEKKLKNVMKNYSKEKKIKKRDYALWFTENDLFFIAIPDCSFNMETKVAGFCFRGSFKTIEADNLLWDILNMPENKKLPLSHRATGMFTAYPYPLVKEKIKIDDDSEEGLFHLLEQKMNELIDLSHIVTADDYYKKVLELKDNVNGDTDKVVAYICTEQKEKAEELLEKMSGGSFNVIGNDRVRCIKELAENYLSNNTP